MSLLTRTCNDVYIVTGPLYLPSKTPLGFVMQHPMIGDHTLTMIFRLCREPYDACIPWTPSTGHQERPSKPMTQPEIHKSALGVCNITCSLILRLLPCHYKSHNISYSMLWMKH